MVGIALLCYLVRRLGIDVRHIWGMTELSPVRRVFVVFTCQNYLHSPCGRPPCGVYHKETLLQLSR